MARQIVILETRKGGDGVTSVNGFHWFPIAVAAARVPLSSFVSAGASLTGPKAITAAEQTSLDDGSVREERFSVVYPSNVTVANVQADLQDRWTTRKAAVDAEPATRQFYGRTWDGTSWTA